jgi:hypothetical protein
MSIVHHHHHHHHHFDGGKLNLKGIGHDLKNVFSPQHLEHAAVSTIPVVTGTVGSMLGGPVGGIAGSMAGNLIEQNIPHGSGFYHKKHPKYNDPAYRKKVNDRMAELRSARTTQFTKGSQEAKDYMAKLRAMRKNHKVKEEPGEKRKRSSAATKAMFGAEPDMSNVTIRKKAPKIGKVIDDDDFLMGNGIRGSRSITRPGRLNYETHKGDAYYHQNGHLVAGNPYANY